MGLAYQNLDAATREAMIKEIEMDADSGNVFFSNNLNTQGKENWIDLLKYSVQEGTDDSLATEIKKRNYLRERTERKTKNGVTMVKVAHTAHTTLAEGEFGRYYARGLCRRAIDEGIDELEVYRAKEVREPRPTSEEKIGMRVKPELILEDLRKTQGVEPSLGLPPGPNSGLTLRIPD